MYRREATTGHNDATSNTPGELRIWYVDGKAQSHIGTVANHAGGQCPGMP